MSRAQDDGLTLVMLASTFCALCFVLGFVWGHLHGYQTGFQAGLDHAPVAQHNQALAR